MASKNTFHSLQILRAIAAWVVVLTHIQQSFYMSKEDNGIWTWFGLHGGIGVDIFFVLSGFVMALAAKNYHGRGVQFGVNRLFRLVPVYWFYTAVLVFCLFVLPEGTYLTLWEGDSLLQSALFIPHENPNGYGAYPTLYVGWTLIYEMFFYLVFALILLCKLPKPSLVCACTMLVLAVVFRWTPFLGHSSLLLIEFAIGIFLFEYWQVFIQQGGRLKKFVPALLLAASVIVFHFMIGNATFMKMSLASLIVYLFIIMENKFSISSPTILWLKNLGDYSYSTYLNHVIVIGWYYWLFGGSQGGAHDVMAITLILVTTALLSKWSYKHVETSTVISSLKSKLLRWGSSTERVGNRAQG